MQTKVVWKFATGAKIPAEARYLCTRVESITSTRREKGIKDPSVVRTERRKENALVWHYYELPLDIAARFSTMGDASQKSGAV